jgi:uncharacterized protein (TIGR00299 family) protein
MEEKPLLYFDCVGGISGDMTLGALIDMGLSLKALTAELDKLKVRGYQLKTSRASRSGIRGTRLRVETPRDKGYRHFADFTRIIERSRLSLEAKEKSLELIRRIFAAEARVHGTRVEKVHLHELGSLDTLVDVVGTVAAMELLGNPDVECSPVNVGSGVVRTEHGIMPVPAPATVLLLKGASVFSDGSDIERTTPTGALLATGFAGRFGPWPAMTLDKVGYGIGEKDPKEGHPNLLRVVLGSRFGGAAEVVLVVETTIDDMSPELVGHVMEKLFDAGALDVFLTPVQMKKNRPGVNLTVTTEPRKRQALVDILFRETTTLGLRVHEVQREVLQRKIVQVDTRFGKVSMKLGLSGEKVLNVAPEFEDCRRIASNKRASLKEVQQAALAAFHKGRKNE